jgi:hypothetical protein
MRQGLVIVIDPSFEFYEDLTGNVLGCLSRRFLRRQSGTGQNSREKNCQEQKEEPIAHALLADARGANPS